MKRENVFVNDGTSQTEASCYHQSLCYHSLQRIHEIKNMNLKLNNFLFFQYGTSFLPVTEQGNGSESAHCMTESREYSCD